MSNDKDNAVDSTPTLVGRCGCNSAGLVDAMNRQAIATLAAALIASYTECNKGRASWSANYKLAVDEARKELMSIKVEPIDG